MTVLPFPVLATQLDHRIVISPGLWRGFEVSVEPPSLSHPLKRAKTFEDAMAHAEALSRQTGWPIISQAAPEPPRAA